MAEAKEEKRNASNASNASNTSKSTSIVRIGGRDIDASLELAKALDKVKGIGPTLAKSIAYAASKTLGVDMHASIGSLTEEQVEKLEEIMRDPASYGVYAYLLNRNRDPETGKPMHFIGSDLIVRTKQDIDQQIKIMSWRGYRHQFGQKVRGQRTRNTGRTGETVGVTKKKAVEKEKEEEKTKAQAQPAQQAKK